VTETVRIAINRATEELADAKVDSPRFEAELLLARATGWPRPVVLIHTERTVPEEALAKFHELVAQRCRRRPLQQILGDTEFFGLKILVDENVLVPRPETELLVEQVIKRWKPGFRTILDIGTGSGCLAAALAKNLPECSVDAVDISEPALKTARRNIELHGLEPRVKLISADLFPENGLKYDVIVSNPPYIPSDRIEGLMPEVSVYEPRSALDGGPDGLRCYHRMAERIGDYVARPGLVVLEVGQGQAEAVSDIFIASIEKSEAEIIPDLSGNKRAVVVST